MRFNRKVLYFMAGVSVLAAAGWYIGRVPYHRWRLAAATAAADRIRAGDYRLADDFIYLLRGEPKTSREYEETIVHHENALIELKYFARTNFVLARPLASNAAQSNFFWQAITMFPDKWNWSASIPTDGKVVTVTTRPHRMKDWERFLREMDHGGGSKVRNCRRARRRQRCSEERLFTAREQIMLPACDMKGHDRGAAFNRLNRNRCCLGPIYAGRPFSTF